MRTIQACLLLLLVGSAYAANPACRPRETSPHRTIPLAAFGVPALTLEPDLPLTKRHDRVAFIDDQTLAISFFAPPERPTLITRRAPSAFRLQLLLIDIDSGNVVLSSSWPARVMTSWIDILDEGRILLSSPQSFTLYSRDLKQLVLIDNADSGSTPHIPTPSGRTLWRTRAAAGRFYFEARSALDLTTRFSWTESEPPAAWSASDETVIGRFDSGPVQLKKKRATGEWKRIFADTGCYPGAPSLVTGDAIIFPSCRDLLLLNDRGDIRSRIPLFRHERLDPNVAGARHGAVALMSLRSRKTRTRRLLAYDTTTLAVIGSISVSLPAVWRYSYAVSPDSKRIAVMADHDVRIYETSTLGCGD